MTTEVTYSDSSRAIGVETTTNARGGVAGEGVADDSRVTVDERTTTVTAISLVASELGEVESHRGSLNAEATTVSAS